MAMKELGININSLQSEIGKLRASVISAKSSLMEDHDKQLQALMRENEKLRGDNKELSLLLEHREQKIDTLTANYNNLQRLIASKQN